MNANLYTDHLGGNSTFISFLRWQQRSRRSGIRQESCGIALRHRITFSLRLRVPRARRSIAPLQLPSRFVVLAIGEGLHPPHLRFLLVRASRWNKRAGRLERVD